MQIHKVVKILSDSFNERKKALDGVLSAYLRDFCAWKILLFFRVYAIWLIGFFLIF